MQHAHCHCLWCLRSVSVWRVMHLICGFVAWPFDCVWWGTTSGYARAHPINVPQCSSSRRPGSATCAARIKTIFLVYIRYTSRVCVVPVPQTSIFLVNIRDTSKVCACAGTTRYHQDIYRLVHMHVKTTNWILWGVKVGVRMWFLDWYYWLLCKQHSIYTIQKAMSD